MSLEGATKHESLRSTDLDHGIFYKLDIRSIFGGGCVNSTTRIVHSTTNLSFWLQQIVTPSRYVEIQAKLLCFKKSTVWYKTLLHVKRHGNSRFDVNFFVSRDRRVILINRWNVERHGVVRATEDTWTGFDFSDNWNSHIELYTCWNILKDSRSSAHKWALERIWKHNRIYRNELFTANNQIFMPLIEYIFCWAGSATLVLTE